MSIQLADRIQKIKPSLTFAISAKARELKAQGHPVINLGVGEPDFDTPDPIKQSAIDAIHQGQTKYTAIEGILPLREAVAAKLHQDNQLQYQPDQILISCGAKQSLFNTFQALINLNDEVIIPAPYWPSYPDMVSLAGGTPRLIFAGLEQHFKITPEQLQSAITPQTKVFLFNSPSNPAGMLYSRAELLALSAVLEQNPHVLLATDDMYEHIVWGAEPFQNLLNVCPALYERTLVINGVSKAYAMTGWRIGYAAGPKNIIKAMKTIQGQSTSGPCSISQAAALSALTGDQTCVQTMVHAFKERHDYLIPALNALPGVECTPADGTFYAFPKIEQAMKKLGFKDDLEFADHLISQAHLAIVPGSAFGAPGYMRLSFATSLDNLQKSIERLQKTLSA